MSQWLVHLGYPKAGSTFLQSALFSGQHPSFHPLGMETGTPILKPGKDLFFSRVDGQRTFVPFDFDAETARRTALAGSSGAPDQVTALSTEELVGHPYSGGVWAESLAHRIHATLPEARILIIVREQRKMVLSAYSDYLERMAGRASLTHFLHPKGIDQVPSHNPAFYRFAQLVEHYVHLFGRDQVLVMTLESLASDAEGAVNRICDFCEVPRSQAWQTAQTATNPRDYATYAAARRLGWASRWVRPAATNGHTGKNIPGLRAAVLKLGRLLLSDAAVAKTRARDLAQIEAALRPHVVDDNARLQDVVDEDLQALGYMMPSKPQS